MACEAEVAAAASWFGEQLFEPNEQRSIFCDRLQELLIARYQGHWYPEEPHRGCAFRALLSTVNSVDPLLLRAADSTGHRGLQESFLRQFSDAGEVTCWINPGEVKVLRGRAQHVIYTDGKGSDNPYEKLRIKIEPTRLAVKVDTVELPMPTSPVSSQGNHSLGGANDAFGAFRHGNSSQGCSSQGCSQSQSPTESPMQSWRANASGPPAMAPLPPHMGSNGGNYGGFNQGFGSEHSYGGFDGSVAMGGMSLGGGFSAPNGLSAQQGQGQQASQVAGAPHASPMRGYNTYAPQSSYGQTPQQPVF